MKETGPDPNPSNFSKSKSPNPARKGEFQKAQIQVTSDCRIPILCSTGPLNPNLGLRRGRSVDPCHVLQRPLDASDGPNLGLVRGKDKGTENTHDTYLPTVVFPGNPGVCLPNTFN